MTRLSTKLENYLLRFFAVVGGDSTLVGIYTAFVSVHDGQVSDHLLLISHDEFIREHKTLDSRMSRIETKLDAVLKEQVRSCPLAENTKRTKWVTRPWAYRPSTCTAAAVAGILCALFARRAKQAPSAWVSVGGAGGSFVASGNGSTTTYTIAHGLGTRRRHQPEFTFSAAPASGSSNIVLNWFAR